MGRWVEWVGGWSEWIEWSSAVVAGRAHGRPAGWWLIGAIRRQRTQQLGWTPRTDPGQQLSTSSLSLSLSLSLSSETVRPHKDRCISGSIHTLNRTYDTYSNNTHIRLTRDGPHAAFSVRARTNFLHAGPNATTESHAITRREARRAVDSRAIIQAIAHGRNGLPWGPGRWAEAVGRQPEGTAERSQRAGREEGDPHERRDRGHRSARGRRG